MASVPASHPGVEPVRRSWVRQIMGMPISLLVRGADVDERAGSLAEALFAELDAVDRRFSTYRSDSELTHVMRGELTLAQCSDELRDVARRCDAARESTGGLFDAVRPDGVWDPTGLVKGWSVERAAARLGDTGWDWCINAGGDVTVHCPSGVAFRVGIQDPYDPGRVIAVASLASGGVATSGNAARGEHIYVPAGAGLAPRAEQAAARRSISVAGPSLEMADVLATAAYAAGPDARSLMTRWNDYSALIVGADRSVIATPGWPSAVDRE